MSFGGLLATALAGGAKVVGEQAGGDIEQRRKEELMREAAAVEEQRQIRVAERIEQLRRQGEMANVEGPLADAKLKYRGKEAAQESETAIARARGMIPVAVEGQQKLLPGKVDEARQLAEAEGKERAKYREQSPSVQKKISEIQAVLGRELNEQEKLSILGLVSKGRDPDTGYETVVDKKYDANGNEIGSVTRKVPIKGGQGGTSEVVDPYAVPRRGDKPVAEAAKPAKKADSAPAGNGASSQAPKYKEATDGSGRIIDVTTGRTLTPEQSEILRKIERGEQTTPRERAILKG